MLSLDIFRDNAFEAVEMRKIVDDLEFVPSMVGDMGLFEPEPIRTTDVAIRKKGDSLELVPTTERGAPFPTTTRDRRSMQLFQTFRVGLQDRVNSHELQNILAEGAPEMVNLENAMTEVTSRFAKMRRNLELTLEKHRLDAMQGILRDADGTVLYNYFTEFGFAQPAEIIVDLSEATNLNIRQWVLDNIRMPMQKALKNRWTPNVRIHAFVGDSWWSKLVSHPRIEKTFEVSQMGAALREGFNVYDTHDYGGVIWHHYAGTYDDTTVDVAADEAKFFPVGAIDSFKKFQAPGESIQDVNTLGEEWYPVVQPDPETQKNRFVDLELATYPLFICLVPQALLRAKHS